MHCHKCEQKIQQALSAHAGVHEVEVDFASGQASVLFDFNQSKLKDACTDLPSGLSCSDTDTAWKIFGGYQFSRYFAAELGYNDFGKATASGVISGVNVDAKVEATAPRALA